MTFQPYQDAEEELINREKAPYKALRKGIGVGASIVGGTSLVNRLVPLLNDFIPESLAKKGIAKLSPQLGKFVESATNLGHDFYDVRDFLRSKAAEETEKKEEKKSQKVADQRNVIQQYSPELHEYLSGEIQKGRSPLEAGALASMQDNFKSVIKKMSEDHRTPFSSILQSIYGSTESPQELQNQQTSKPAIDKSQILGSMQKLTELISSMTGRGNG